MVAGARLDLTTDTSDVKRGMGDIEDALDDVSDALDDVGKDGDDASAKLERSFSDMARETKKEARDMQKDVGKSFDKMEKQGGEATKKMQQDGTQEAEQLASSFDGSAESIVDGFQGAAASMFSGFGPLGAAAGLAAAAGIGLITKELQDAQEEADNLAAATDEMVAQMLEAGTTFVTEQDKLNMVEALLGDAEKRAEAQEFADKIGIPLVEFAAGMFDIGEKREIVEGKIAEHYDDEVALLEQMGVLGTGFGITTGNKRREEEKALELLRGQDKILEDSREIVEDIFGLRKDVNGQIREEIEGVEHTGEEYGRIARMDVTPKLNIEAEAKRQVREAQRAIDGLTGKDLQINVRVVR
jgi:phosphoglycolate phosphatase-like HAD superfamily hydrolase